MGRSLTYRREYPAGLGALQTPGNGDLIHRSCLFKPGPLSRPSLRLFEVGKLLNQTGSRSPEDQ
jgi:hypothetical protein